MIRCCRSQPRLHRDALHLKALGKSKHFDSYAAFDIGRGYVELVVEVHPGSNFPSLRNLQDRLKPEDVLVERVCLPQRERVDDLLDSDVCHGVVLLGKDEDVGVGTALGLALVVLNEVLADNRLSHL